MPEIKEQDAPQKKDLDDIGNHIRELYNKRKSDRCDLDSQWDEIERQLRMDPDPEREKIWRASAETQWMPVLEQPWQAETHELLTADIRRLQWPTSASWFDAKPDDTDELLENIRERMAQTLGTDVDVTHKEVASLTESTHLHFERLYPFRQQWNRANGDAITYGHFVFRGRIGQLSAFSGGFRGYKSPRKIPMLCHIPARSAYLDDMQSAIQANGLILKPLHIIKYNQRVEDLKLAMIKGSTDQTNEVTGGWIKDALGDIDIQDKDVTILEAEGDLVVPKSEKSLVFENVCVNVVIGTGMKTGGTRNTFARVVRFRRRALPFSSFIVHHYHQDQSDTPYGTSPLMKGRTLQKMGSEGFMRLAQALILNTEPCIGYDRSDPTFAKTGGPRIFPRAKWGTLGDIKVHEIGDPQKLWDVYAALKTEYQDVTSTNPPRLGQQTKSHQTAYAVDTEIQRSVVRTVDYLRSLEDDPALTWLHMEGYMLKKVLRKPERIWVDEFKQWLDISADMFPDRCDYDVLGSAEPIEEREEEQKAVGALNMLMQADMAAQQLGFQPSDWDKIREYIAKEGFGDGAIFQPRATQPFGGMAQGNADGGGVPGASGQPSANELVALATGTANRGVGS